MLPKKYKPIIYLLLLSIAAMPVATAFASIQSIVGPLELTVDAELSDIAIQSGKLHDSSHHSTNRDMSDHVVKASDHCDTNKVECNQCDNCSHCINLAGCGYSKLLPLLDHQLISNYSDLYHSIDQSLLFRPPIRS